MDKKIEHLFNLIRENPELPIVPMVDYEVVSEDYGRWLGSFGYSEVGEYALYDDKYFNDREEFKETYLNWNDEELCEKFEYDPAISFYGFDDGRYTQEQVEVNQRNEKLLDEYLDKIADEYFTKAILVNIDLPD